jgi:hypothetical protein
MIYWILLPPNAERQLAPNTVPLRDSWIRKLNAGRDVALALLALGRRIGNR